MTHDTIQSFRLPTPTVKAVKALADSRQITKSEVLRQALAVYLLAQPQPKHEAKPNDA